MKHLLTITLAASLAAAATAGAAPLKPDHLSAGTRWFLHVDLDGLRETEVGKELVQQLEEKKGRQFRALKRMFSVNPLTDLAGVTLQGPGGKDLATVLIDGRFDRAHIEDIISGAEDYGSERHGDFTIHHWTDEKQDKAQFAAFVTDNLVAFSESEDLLEKQLDVLAGKSAAAAADAFYGKGGASALVAGWAGLAEIEMDGEDSKLLRKADELRLAVTENAGKLAVRLAIDAPDPETAELMRRVLDGIAAFAELAEVVGSEVGFKVALSQDGKRVDATIDMPVAKFLEMVEEHGVLDDKDEDCEKEDDE